jgi:hypothetical protein
MRRIFIALTFFAPFFALGQDLTGVWQGHFRSNTLAARSTLADERYKFEVQIAQQDKSLEAVTYSYLSSLFYAKAAASGAVNLKTNKVLIQEGKLLEVRNQFGDICIMTCFLQYTKSGDDEFLEGSYVSMNVRDSSNCGKGTVFLRKMPSSDFYKEPFLVKKEKEEDMLKHRQAPEKPAIAAINKNTTGHTGAPAGIRKNKPDSTAASASAKRNSPGTARPPAVTTTKNPPANSVVKTAPAPHPPVPHAPPEKHAPASTRVHSQPGIVSANPGDTLGSIGKKFPTIPPKVLLSRSNQLVKAITVDTHEVELNIYDDGAIDHDTISVYVDNKQVIDHAMLTDRAIVLKIHLDETEDFHEVVLVAENEGEIPPNTSLMIVKAGDKEYEVRITSTEQKNAVVTFKFEKSK